MQASGLLIVVHAPLGSALLQVITHILGELPTYVKILEIAPNAEREIYLDQGLLLLKQINHHRGVVIFSDCKGSTPGNIAQQIHSVAHNSSLVFGVNLPMLLRAINYAVQPHAVVAAAAITGGKAAIVGEEQAHD
jgi:PTS system ascorbate-specific IIA component